MSQVNNDMIKLYLEILLKMTHLKWILLSTALIGVVQMTSASFDKKNNVNEKDLMRKAIVFDKNTPNLFYCSTHKPSMNKMIVRNDFPTMITYYQTQNNTALYIKQQ
ncbi:hypothetical protein DOY81_008342 [Sarcophaga bullata]|nr:hypothetical protein DOY81_008342 [Sarcophaga bullata]